MSVAFVKRHFSVTCCVSSESEVGSRQAQTLERGTSRSTTDVWRNEQFENGDIRELNLAEFAAPLSNVVPKLKGSSGNRFHVRVLSRSRRFPA